MALQLHHVYVLTSVGAPEADDLLDSGLVEGSPNTHLGQGTANRRFFFESGFLELLWVHDEREAQSTLTAPTKLWDRWAERGRTANPFGICFSSRMRSVSVGLPDPPSISSSLRAIRDAGLVKVHLSATPELVIEFTSQKEVQHSVPALGLSMVGRQTAPPNKSPERTRGR
jgi:hypothetical protein